MNKILKEILWFCLPVISAIITVYILKSVTSISLLINFHESVYITNATDIVQPLIIIFGFIIYLARSLRLKFQNKTCNLIYLTYNTLAILLMSLAIYLNEKLSIDEGWAIYPPLSSTPQKIEFNNFIANPLYLILIQLLFVLLLVYNSFKIGKKYTL